MSEKEALLSTKPFLQPMFPLGARLHSEDSFLRTCNIRNYWEKTKTKKKLFE